MAQAARVLEPLSVADYLELEERSQVKHEYVEGWLYAMSGSTLGHNLVGLNVFAALRGAARPKGCQVYFSDVKVFVPSGRFYYPDVVATCAPFEAGAVYVNAPYVIVEVLSPSTQATDRREKLRAYLTLQSLETHLIVDPDARHVEVHARVEDGWRASVYTGGEIELPCLDARLALEDIYDGLEVSADEEEPL